MTFDLYMAESILDVIFTNFDGLVSESGSTGTYNTVLGGLSRGLGITLGVTLSADNSCDDDGGSLSLPLKKRLVKWVPENVPVMPIPFLFHK